MKDALATIGLRTEFQGFRLSDGSVVNVQILDTAGQERFNAITESYYRDADCCLLVYDITSEESFEKIENYYIDELKKNNDQIKKVILLGNKTDLKDKRQIDHEKGSGLATKHGYIFMETSCKDNYNVSDAFTALIEMTNTELKKKGENKKPSKVGGFGLTPKNNQPKKKGCC